MRRHRLVQICVALLLTLSVVVTAIYATRAVAASSAAPLPLWQRMLLGGEYRGYTPQHRPPPLGTLASTSKALHDFFQDLRPGQANAELRRDGFRAAEGEDLRGPKNHGAFSGVLQLATHSGAVNVQKFVAFHSIQPCRHTCTVTPINITVPGIPGALGTERIRHVADSPKPADQPFEIDIVSFIDGPFAYIIISSGPPDGVDHNELFAAAKRLYERTKGAPAA